MFTLDLSHYKKINKREDDELEINMVFMEPVIDKIKILKENREKVIDIIFDEPEKYLDKETFEDMCNNLEF